jgi:hypothetical protein
MRSGEIIFNIISVGSSEEGRNEVSEKFVPGLWDAGRAGVGGKVREGEGKGEVGKLTSNNTLGSRTTPNYHSRKSKVPKRLEGCGGGHRAWELESWAGRGLHQVGARRPATRAGKKGRKKGSGGGGQPGQCAPPALHGKSPREAAARALALPARRPPRGTRRRRRLLPARGPAGRQHAAARLFPAARRRPPGRNEGELPGCPGPGEGAGGAKPL